MVPMQVLGVQVDADSGMPVVLLQEVPDPHRVLPIFIGPVEAAAIARGLEGEETEHVLTHDLLVALLVNTNTELAEVAVSDMREGTYFAELRLDGPRGRRVVSSRPSDAIALAVRTHSPVYASEGVLEEAGVFLLDADEVADEMVGEFREFLDRVDPADFARDPDETDSDTDTDETD